MKKVFSIFLIVCLTIPFAGTYFWLQFRKHQVKKEVKRKIIRGIAKEELVLLKFSVKEIKTVLNWKHSKEFEYNGEMYDVVNTEYSGDSVYYRVWWDHEETKLEKQLKNLADMSLGKDPITKNRVERYNSFINSLFFKDVETNELIAEMIKENFSIYLIEYDNIISPPPTPPPNPFC